MDYNSFFKMIASNNICGAYLLHGDEEYIKQSALTAIKKHIAPAVSDMNVVEYHAPLFTAVREACETLPFFSEKRIVIAHEMAEAEIKQLFPYALDMPPTTTLIVLVRGKASASAVKPFSGIDRDILFSIMSEADAIRFVEKRARSRGIAMSGQTAALLVSMVGTQARELENEFTKAADYVMDDGEITPLILKTCVTPQIEYETFRMLDQLLSGKSSEALVGLRHMLNNSSSSAIMMAHFLTHQLEKMYSAKLLLDSGVREDGIAAKLSLNSWAARTAVRGAKFLSAGALKEALLAISMADYMQISGRRPAECIIEQTIMKYFMPNCT